MTTEYLRTARRNAEFMSMEEPVPANPQDSSVPYSGEMLPNVFKLVNEIGDKYLAERHITKLVERVMPATFEDNADLFKEFWALDPIFAKWPELLGTLAAHLDRATIRHCMENVIWRRRMHISDALKDAYSRKCEGEYCLSNDSTRAQPCLQAIEASQDPEVVLCKKCREQE